MSDDDLIGVASDTDGVLMPANDVDVAGVAGGRLHLDADQIRLAGDLRQPHQIVRKGNGTRLQKASRPLFCIRLPGLSKRESFSVDRPVGASTGLQSRSTTHS